MEKTNETKPEPTIWRTPDDLWEIVEKVLARDYPKRPQDRKRVSLRPVLDGILYKLRAGCPWNQLPKEFGDDSAIHRHFQSWCQEGLFDEIWREALLQCEELKGVQWEWQSADKTRKRGASDGQSRRKVSDARGRCREESYGSGKKKASRGVWSLRETADPSES